MSLAETFTAPILARSITIEIWDGTQPLGPLDIVDGTITHNLAQAIAGSIDLTVAADTAGSLVPRSRDDWLQPLGNELHVTYTATIDGTTLEASVGVYGIEKPTSSATAGGDPLTLKVTGVDRAASIQSRRWVDPYTIAANTNVATAIHDLIDSRRSGLAYNLAATAHTVPVTVLGVERDNDPWKDAQDIATAAGLNLSFDENGAVVLAPELDPATVAPQWTFIEGETCTMGAVSRALDSEHTYNGVIVTGGGAGNYQPRRAEVWDTDPSSPTYYLGPFGKKPYFFHSPVIQTHQQAVDAANALFPKVTRVSERVELSARANPFVRAGHVVEVARENVGVSGTYLVESIRLDLGVGPMSLTLRERSV